MSRIRPETPAQISRIPTIIPVYHRNLKNLVMSNPFSFSSSTFLLKKEPLRFLSYPVQVRAIKPLINTMTPAELATQSKKLLIKDQYSV
ncbi:MAG: hypothetical protein ACTSUL_00550 [Promethearchaeota archaeon]